MNSSLRHILCFPTSDFKFYSISAIGILTSARFQMKNNKMQFWECQTCYLNSVYIAEDRVAYKQYCTVTFQIPCHFILKAGMSVYIKFSCHK
jgi:hypothetical protein